MIYGLYLSATGVLTNSYRQDVIANNLANAETVGFKRSLALFQERRAEAQEQGRDNASNPMLDKIGGGMLLAPTYVDQSQGTLEETGNNLDVAIHGQGFFTVKDGSEIRLTRNGRFMVDRQGYLILADGSPDHRVLDSASKPIRLGGVPQSEISIDREGSISAGQEVLARLAFVDVPDPGALRQRGGTLLNYPGDVKRLPRAQGTIQSRFVESSNVDPTTELTQLINAQRQLEANASMIRYQDQALGRLVNDVGKIG
jgi:flagellar basal-body rod protein FlgG